MREIKKEQIWVDTGELSGHWRVDQWEYFVVKDIRKGKVFIRQVYLYDEGHSHEGWVSEVGFRQGYKWATD